jgi:hypothetical protein
MNTEPDTENQRSDHLCKCRVFSSLLDEPLPQMRCDLPAAETIGLPCIRWRGHFGMCNSQLSWVCGHRLDQHGEQESPSLHNRPGPGECLLCGCAGFDSVEDEIARGCQGAIEGVHAMADVDRDGDQNGWLTPTWEEYIGHAFEQQPARAHFQHAKARPAIALVIAESCGPPRLPIDALRALQQREVMMAQVEMTLEAWRTLWNGLLGEVWLD